MVEVQNTEEMWILPALLAAYISKLGCFGPYSLRIFFSALDVYMTRRSRCSRCLEIEEKKYTAQFPTPVQRDIKASCSVSYGGDWFSLWG